MKLTWTIEDKDVAQVRALMAAHAKKPFVLERAKRNLSKAKALISEQRFWRSMVCMRLTSQQKSGPDSHVAKFSGRIPFPLDVATVRRAKDVQSLASRELKRHGGIRFIETISQQLAENFEKLEAGLWKDTLDRCNGLTKPSTRHEEVAVADHIQTHFKGFGPKQSRNVLQALGLTRYEIPIDSRLSDWLNGFGFPLHLSAHALGDRNYYAFVSEGIQMLCERANVFPCVFDAAVFASKDKGQWTKDQLIF